MKLAPLGNRITVKPETVADKKGLLFIPDMVKNREEPQIGTVIEVGNEVVEIKAGDNILFGKGSGTKIKVKEQEFLIIRSCDVFAIIGE